MICAGNCSDLCWDVQWFVLRSAVSCAGNRFVLCAVLSAVCSTRVHASVQCADLLLAEFS